MWRGQRGSRYNGTGSGSGHPARGSLRRTASASLPCRACHASVSQRASQMRCQTKLSPGKGAVSALQLCCSAVSSPKPQLLGFHGRKQGTDRPRDVNGRGSVGLSGTCWLEVPAVLEGANPHATVEHGH